MLPPFNSNSKQEKEEHACFVLEQQKRKGLVTEKFKDDNFKMFICILEK